MHSALHDHHRNILNIAKHKSSFVPKYRRDRKSFNVMIIQNRFHLNLLCIITKSGTENQSYLRFETNLFSHTVVTSQ